MDFFYHYLLTKQNGFPNSIFVVKSFFHNYINFESCYLVKSFISENIKFISFKKTQRIIFLTCHIKCHVQWETIFLFEIVILKIIIKTFSPFCRLFFFDWKRLLLTAPKILSCILSQYLWCNKYIQVDKKTIHFINLSKKI